MAGRCRALMVVLAALAGQVVLTSHWQDLRSRSELLPPPPPPALLRLESFGDEEARFRLLALEVQNFGDGEGQFTALKDYDYPRLLQWLELLDGMEMRSQASLALAGALYGQTGQPKQARLMADYLHRRAMSNPARNWHWLVLAVHLARFRAHDPALAMQIALDLAAIHDPSIPAWTREMPRFIMSRIEDKDAARQMVEAILSSRPDLAAQDRKALERFAR